jgi:hypothetical protein
VWARSAAEIPVVMPWAASTLTVKAVRWPSQVPAGHLRQVEFLGAAGGERRADQAAAVDGHEIDHFRVHSEAAPIRSASFSRPGIVGADDQAAGGDFRDDFIDGTEQDLRLGHGWRDCGRNECGGSGQQET